MPSIPGLDLEISYHADGSIAWPAPDPNSPFYIVGPALISFSGGRTSALMLFLCLWAHGGELPTDVFVCFANTGKEREETLRFVYECGLRWGARIHWLEWFVDPATPPRKRLPPGDRFREVGFNSASRHGEPFQLLIERRGFLPNVVTRFCTSALKINTMECFMRAQGVLAWTNAVGLRADEMNRVFKQLERNEAGRRGAAVMPLAKAGITKAIVLAWWQRQPFDLQLRGYEGNCDLCFLKGEQTLLRLMRDRPDLAAWWKEQEDLRAGKTRDPKMSQFSARHSYAELERRVDQAPFLGGLELEALDFDAECGLTCAGDVARALGDQYNRGCARRSAAEQPQEQGGLL